MNGKIRHIYPGGNTPEGFFSYYSYIMGQQEANRIICLKGGPGVGKSTFMRKIGEHFVEKGEDVDFLWCSSDPGSLDGIVLKKRRIAMIDATSPHIVDPVNPGAVDSIVHLGEFWNGEALKKCKSHVLESNEKIKRWFEYAYHYLAAAGNLYDALADIYEDALEDGELYKKAAEIIGEEMGHKEIALNPGCIKKQFASAITPAGVQHHLESLIDGYRRIYMITAPVGMSNARLLNLIAESALYRGMDIEAYYCPMKPETKLEHLLVPQIETAFVSLNSYHDLDPWDRPEEVKLIDVNDMMDWSRTEEAGALAADCERRMEELLNEGVRCIIRAKKEHDRLESYYIPNMDFKKIDGLRDEIIGKIERNVL